MAHLNDIRVHGPTLAERFAQLREALATRRAERKVYRETYRELNALGDRELADLGIHRSMIGSIARQAANRA